MFSPSHMRAAALVAAVAGSALLLPGCGAWGSGSKSSPRASSTGSSTPPAWLKDRPTDREETKASWARASESAGSMHEPGTRWQTAPNKADADRAFQSSSRTWDDIESGWTVVGNAGSAERPVSRQTPQTRRNTGPADLGARVYQRVLGAEMPEEDTSRNATVTTANLRQITFTHEGAAFDPAVSKDGQYVVFASTQHRPTADIYIQRLNSRVITRLTDDPGQDVMPSLSPDGQRVAFASNRNGTWDIFVMPITGGQAVQITADPSHDLHPSWSPDGRRLVFSRLGQTSGRWELWVTDVDSATSSQFIGYGLFPQWCPVPGTGRNGADRIVFQRSRERGDRSFGVWAIDYDADGGSAGRETELVSSPSNALINPTWSPDGKFIVYAAVPNPGDWPDEADGRPEYSSLFMIGADGGGRVKLTGGNAVDLMPVWSASGDLFFVSDRGGIENLWSMDVTGAVLAATGTRPARDDAFATVPTDD